MPRNQSARHRVCFRVRSLVTRVLFVPLSIFTARAADPHLSSSTLTAGAGVGLPVSGYRTNAFHTGPSFVGEYEFGLHKYIAATVGVDNLVLPFDNYSRFETFTTHERVTLMPFGLRATVPLAVGRAELFAGAGAAYLWSSAYDLNNVYNASNFLFQLNGGARFALDNAKHFRLGPTVRFYRDLGRPTQQWLSISADLSYLVGN